MPAPGPRYSVVVPAYDEEALLPSTLESIRAAMSAVPWPGDLVVCDNNSKDRTAGAERAGGARFVGGGSVVLMTICPFLSRSRTFCRIWYRRPAA